jgi:predicted phage tail protein
MLTEVILDGQMGKKFGRKWSLNISRPCDALSLIDANVGNLFFWMRGKLKRYEVYKVVCEYEDGRVEQIGENEYQMFGKIKRIRFTPIIKGSGGKGVSIGQMILGAVMVVIGVLLIIFTAPTGVGPMFGVGFVMAGVGMMLGGIVGLLTPQPKLNGSNDQADASKMKSDYFDGPENTSKQGVPVPLIYGEVMVGSHPISVAYDVVDKSSESAMSGYPTSWQAGMSNDPIWEEVLAGFNAAHAAQYGVPMNRPWPSDADSMSAYNGLIEEWKSLGGDTKGRDADDGWGEDDPVDVPEGWSSAVSI